MKIEFLWRRNTEIHIFVGRMAINSAKDACMLPIISYAVRYIYIRTNSYLLCTYDVYEWAISNLWLFITWLPFEFDWKRWQQQQQQAENTRMESSHATYKQLPNDFIHSLSLPYIRISFHIARPNGIDENHMNMMTRSLVYYFIPLLANTMNRTIRKLKDPCCIRVINLSKDRMMIQ